MMETPIPPAWSRETIIDYENRFVNVIDRLGHGQVTNKFVAEVFGKAKDNRIASVITHLDIAHNAQNILQIGQKEKFNLQALRTDTDLRDLVGNVAETIALDEGLTEDDSFWPQNEQEWKDFAALAIPVLGEVFISLTPIGDVKDLVDAFNGGTNTEKATAVAFFLISLTPADTIKDAVKSIRIVRKAIVVMNKLRKFRRAAVAMAKQGFKTTLDATGKLIVKKGGQVLARGETAVKKLLEVVNVPKGSRPDPSTYLDATHITTHLDKFKDGVTKITANTPTRPVGPPGGTFVLPKSQADDLIKKSGGDPKKLEDLLGLDRGTLGNNPVRVDTKDTKGLRMSSGNEPGDNGKWLPGGQTSGGVLEATVDQIPLDKITVKPAF